MNCAALFKYFFCGLAVSFFVFSCSNKTQDPQVTETKKITNPNGMSEMSLIMEDWFRQLDVYSKRLKEKKTIENFVSLNHEKIYTAEVSKKKDNVHGEQFNAFTENFFYNYDNIGAAATYEEQVKQFNLAVNSCINCHEQHCQGPIVRIKKLKVAE